jgi:hypothetical protein
MAKISAQQQDAVPAGNGNVPQSVIGKQIASRGIAIITGMVNRAQAIEAGQAAAAIKGMVGMFGADATAELPGLGTSGAPSIGGSTQQRGRDKYSIPGVGMPSGRDLTTDFGEAGDPHGTHTSNGAGDDREHRGSVWVDHSTERTSSDGAHTWGGVTYRDWSGNFWHTEYQVDHNEDGGTTSKETVYDNHNEPIKTTVIETNPEDGSETITTTDHQTGQTTTTAGQVKPEAPPADSEAQTTVSGKDKNQGETTGFSAAPFQPKKLVSPNKVNPGPDGGQSQQQPVAPLRLDPKILVINPLPDAAQATNVLPRDIKGQNINLNTTDPPRPLQ